MTEFSIIYDSFEEYQKEILEEYKEIESIIYSLKILFDKVYTNELWTGLRAENFIEDVSEYWKKSKWEIGGENTDIINYVGVFKNNLNKFLEQVKEEYLRTDKAVSIPSTGSSSGEGE